MAEVDGSDLGELPTADVLAGDEGSTINKINLDLQSTNVCGHVMWKLCFYIYVSERALQ